MKKYMVVEKFKPGCFELCYERFEERGRTLPIGLNYLNSWVNKEENLCFQLMETNEVSLFEVWVENWKDLVDFEIIPIDL